MTKNHLIVSKKSLAVQYVLIAFHPGECSYNRRIAIQFCFQYFEHLNALSCNICKGLIPTIIGIEFNQSRIRIFCVGRVKCS